MDEEFVITGEYIELNKLLKASGLCITGGQTKSIIENGLITVDGDVEKLKRRKITDGMVVKYGKHSVKVLCQKENKKKSW